MKPLSWKFVAQVIVIPLAWLVIWFVLVLIAHIFGFSVSDTGSLLSVIGGAMGAVFAVGGVIVALVSILTQIQLQDRVNLEVSKAKKAVEDKFEKEIRIEYEKRIQEQVKGSLAFFRATDAVNAGNWQQAEALTREALDNYPELQEARSSLAIRMSEQIQKGFSLLIPLGQTLPQYQPSFDIEVSNLNRYLLFETKSYAINSHGNLHILTAIHWLEDALRYRDNPGYRVSAELSLMYGYSQSYIDMIKTLRDALSGDASLFSYFQSPNRLMMLIYGCKGDTDCIQELLKTLHYKLPEEQDILEIINRLQLSNYDFYADWYALKNVSDIFVKVRIFYPNKEKKSYATIFEKGQMPAIVPKQDTSTVEKLMPIDKLIEELFNSYTFICLFLNN